jgi:hypothetical protein
MVKKGLYDDETIGRPEFSFVNEYENSGHQRSCRELPIRGARLCTGENDGSGRTGKVGRTEKARRVLDVYLPGRSLMVTRGESTRKGSMKWCGRGKADRRAAGGSV